mgnify:CR=1 FL=1
MNDKTKRIILITVCCLLCGAAVIGIAGRFGGNTDAFRNGIRQSAGQQRSQCEHQQ